MSDDRASLEAVLDAEYREVDPADNIPRAAVAAIFRRTDESRSGAELLFIQRAAKPTDPWSGQMAFPGGRSEPSDSSAQATAIRETSEEVGLDLGIASFIGSLSELDGGRTTRRRVNVSAHAFWLDGPRPTLTPNHEVADVIWVPMTLLEDRARYIDYHYPLAGTDFPGIQLDRDDQVIWGLTLRLLSDLFRRLDRPFIPID
ncbi:MAG: CoA pyrophosphatase [Actinomycetota bacterium]